MSDHKPDLSTSAAAAGKPDAPTGAAAAPPLAATSRPHVSSGFRLQWEPAQSCHVLLYPEGMIKLNQSAGEIMSRCDGQRELTQIVADLERAFSATNLEPDVRAFMAIAHQQRWLEWS
jgi:pyrroloquinoline quinone biosynthesis protein D